MPAVMLQTAVVGDAAAELANLLARYIGVFFAFRSFFFQNAAGAEFVFHEQSWIERNLVPVR